MATTNYTVEQVSQDLGDYWKGTTTGAGGVTTLVDKALINEDDDAFVTARTQIHMLSGAASGESAGVASKADDTLTVKTGADFSAGTGSGSSYEIHRLFTRKEKEDAITRALAEIFPVLFKLVQETVTIVADQYDYTLTNFNYTLQPSTVTLRSSGDSELETTLFNWYIKPDDGKLHLRTLPLADRVLVVEGIIPPAIADLSDLHAQLLATYAAIDLVRQAQANSPNDNVARWRQVEQQLVNKARERRARYAPIAPAATQRTETYQSTHARTWRGA